MKLERPATPASSLAPLAFDDIDEPVREVDPARRRKLVRYVSATVFVCVALCGTALIRVAVAHLGSAPDEAYVARAATASVAPATVAATPPAATIETAAPVASAPAPAKTAGEEKDAARHALEHGRSLDALTFATHATQLDRTDADAWLLLGAANQALGHPKEARAAFWTCAKAAKKGPVRECRSMLR